MSISSQLPPISLAQASASLRDLAQAAGQTIEARVLSQASNGTAQVQIGRQTLSLALPKGQVVGSTLTLSVQQTEGQLRLAIVAVRPPAIPSVSTPLPRSVPAPATTVQLSSAALSTPSPVQPVGGAVPSSMTAPTPGPAAQFSGQVGVATGSSPSAPPAGGHPVATLPPAQAGPQTPVSAVSTTPSPSGAPGSSPIVGPQGGGAPASLPATPIPGSGIAVSGAVTPASSTATTATPLQAGSAPPLTTVAVPTAATGLTISAPVRGANPYAVPAASPGTPASSATLTATTSAKPPVAQVSPGTMVGQHAPQPNGAPPASSPGISLPTGATSPVPPALTPQGAIAQMVQQSLPRQDSIVGLTTALTAIAGRVALPEPVAKAAQQILAARLPLDGAKLTGTGMKAAIQMSGLFQEALLASGQGAAAATDLKSGLMALRQTLGAWLGNQAPVAQTSAIAPPMRGHIPRARGRDSGLSALPDDPAELGKFLLERTDAALSRLRLHQNASLPDFSAHRQDAQWSLDLPVIVGGQQQLLHMQIQRDAEQDAERSEDRSWQVRFAINLADRGEVGAQISLRAKNTSGLLWADRDETAQSLASAVQDLRQSLGEAGLVAGAIVVRAGAPVDEPAQPGSAGEHVLDALR